MTTALFRDPVTGQNGRLDIESGTVYDARGNEITRMIPIHADCAPLAEYAAMYCYSKIAQQVGHPVTFTDADGDERLVTMDLGTSDVHVPSNMPNYAAGYRLPEGIADRAAPVLLVNKDNDRFQTWDKENAFGRVQVLANVAGAAVQEVNPTLSNDSYKTNEYALSSFITTEVIANADVPLRPQQVAMRKILDALLVEREIRVANLLTNPANWDTSVVTALGATAKWNGGTTSDPVAALQTAIESSFMTPTAVIMSDPVMHAFVRNAAVQKYFTYKSSAAPVPNAQDLSALLQLPVLIPAKMKYQAVVGGPLIYPWGTSCVLLHEPASNPPTDQQDIATAYTFRWNGGMTPDGQMTAGMLVRMYFDQRRGGRGGNTIVVAHNDAEKMTSKFVGGLITGCIQ